MEGKMYTIQVKPSETGFAPHGRSWKTSVHKWHRRAEAVYHAALIQRMSRVLVRIIKID